MPNKKITLGIDLDGTVAKWGSIDTFEDLLKAGYYYNLPEEEGLIRNIKNAYDEGLIEPVVISSYLTETMSPLMDKKLWCVEHLPFVRKHVFVPYGKNKATVAANEGVLIDNNFIMLEDYTPALNDVVKAGGIGLKFMNGINGNNGSWEGYKLFKEAVDNYDWFLSVYINQIISRNATKR